MHECNQKTLQAEHPIDSLLTSLNFDYLYPAYFKNLAVS